MCKNIFNMDFVVKKSMEGRSLFSWKILEVRIFDQHQMSRYEVKTSKSSQRFCRNSKFMIMDYLPCPCKFPFQNCFFGINFLFIIRFPKFLLHIL